MKFLSESTINKIIDAESDLRYKVIFLLLRDTGARANEILQLKFDDIDIVDKNITITTLKRKDRQKRTVPITNQTLTLLLSYLKNWNVYNTNSRKKYSSDKLFCVDYDTILKRFKEICKSLNIDNVGLHIFRHSFASNFIKRVKKMKGRVDESDLLILSRILGHKRLETTTDIYIHISASQIDETYRMLFEKT